MLVLGAENQVNYFDILYLGHSIVEERPGQNQRQNDGERPSTPSAGRSDQQRVEFTPPQKRPTKTLAGDGKPPTAPLRIAFGIVAVLSVFH